ncbi:hypothetical protein EVAR_87537_1 [Eumeta japonica]|uniref:Uncharacterized protein n=1 Tax=Eumeta variegata TaxID=151549 RepID=A0A4C1XP04_EUMVA|nr:hypothetical protein EVAR_87537_1 [Eumeta japonica]
MRGHDKWNKKVTRWYPRKGEDASTEKMDMSRCPKMNTAKSTDLTDALRCPKIIITINTAPVEALLLEGLPDCGDCSDVDTSDEGNDVNSNLPLASDFNDNFEQEIGKPLLKKHLGDVNSTVGMRY